MHFRFWLEEQRQMPVLYHGRRHKYPVLQPGSMLTEDIVWAAGYTTKVEGMGAKETFIGLIHVVKPTFQNPYVNLGSLHDAEAKLIELSQITSGGLVAAARKVHQEYGYDAIVANFRGNLAGAITLVDLPVDSYIDPVEVIRQRKDDPRTPEGLVKALPPK